VLIGAHVSQAGGLARAIGRGVERGCYSIQIFNQSPRMWRPTAYTEDDFAGFREAMASSPIKAVLIHAVYLLNCASGDPQIRDKTRTSLIYSLRVGDAIGAQGVVLHAGSAERGHIGEAIERAGAVIGEALSASDHCRLQIENTAGAGGTLGRSFEELAGLIEAAGGDRRLQSCLDSCHLFASGYELRTREALADVLDEYDQLVGLDRLASLHINDSMAALGANRDRHAVLGEGEIGEQGLAVFLSEPRFEGLPCVLETGRDGGAPAIEDVSLAFKLRKRGLAARRRATASSATHRSAAGSRSGATRGSASTRKRRA
jgi:deoxyribonuclease-4